MNQAPASLWNEVARKVQLETEWAKVMFQLDEEELDEALESQNEALRANGASEKVALAYQTMLPLCLENAALQKFVELEDNPELTGLFPDLNTPEEAAQLAAREFDLRKPDLDNLLAMLNDLYRSR